MRRNYIPRFARTYNQKPTLEALGIARQQPSQPAIAETVATCLETASPIDPDSVTINADSTITAIYFKGYGWTAQGWLEEVSAILAEAQISATVEAADNDNDDDDMTVIVTITLDGN